MPYMVGFVYGLAFVVLHFSITDSYLDARLGKADKPKPVVTYGTSVMQAEPAPAELPDPAVKKDEKVCTPNAK